MTSWNNMPAPGLKADLQSGGQSILELLGCQLLGLRVGCYALRKVEGHGLHCILVIDNYIIVS
jgi:hypothetical protein